MAVFVLCWPGLGTWEGRGVVLWLKVGRKSLRKARQALNGLEFISVRLGRRLSE